MDSRIMIEDFAQELRAWGDSIESQSLEEPLMSLSPLVFKDFDDHFMQSLGPDGPWAPRTRNYPWPILIKTGFLIRAATESNAPGNIHRYRGDALEFGVDVSVVNYAGFHEYGTRKMPARPWAYLSEDAADAAAEQLLDRLYTLFVE